MGLAEDRRGPRESAGMDSEASDRERCLALIVGQLRGVGRIRQPEFSQDVSSSRGDRWIQVFLWDSIAPGEAILVSGAWLGRGTQNLVPSRNFWALAYTYLPVPILPSSLL